MELLLTMCIFCEDYCYLVFDNFGLILIVCLVFSVGMVGVLVVV